MKFSNFGTGTCSDSDDLEIWDDEEDEDDILGDAVQNDAPSSPSFSNDDLNQKNACAMLMWLIGFLLNLHTKYYIPDAAMNLLIQFFCAFVCVTGRFSSLMKEVSSIFPKSLPSMIALVNGEPSFTKFVVCRKCHALYSYASCQEKIGSHAVSKGCAKIAFPNHPHHPKRISCNFPLLRSVEVNSGRVLLYPHKVYCYMPLKSSLQNLFLRPSFYEQCQHWKTRSVNTDGMLNDVYDGAVWKEFHSFFHTSFAVGVR